MHLAGIFCILLFRLLFLIVRFCILNLTTEKNREEEKMGLLFWILFSLMELTYDVWMVARQRAKTLWLRNRLLTRAAQLVLFSHGAFGYYQSNTSTYM